jgi:hypothetical protein
MRRRREGAGDEVADALDLPFRDRDGTSPGAEDLPHPGRRQHSDALLEGEPRDATAGTEGAGHLCAPVGPPAAPGDEWEERHNAPGGELVSDHLLLARAGAKRIPGGSIGDISGHSFALSVTDGSPQSPARPLLP